MCGIVAILNVKEQTHVLRDKALKMSQKIRHRGPDWSGIYCGGSAILAHGTCLPSMAKSITIRKSVAAMPDNMSSKRVRTVK